MKCRSRSSWRCRSRSYEAAGRRNGDRCVATLDAESERQFGQPSHQTLLDPPFCALNLQNLMEYYEILRIRAPQNTYIMAFPICVDCLSRVRAIRVRCQPWTRFPPWVVDRFSSSSVRSGAHLLRTRCPAKHRRCTDRSRSAI